MREAREVIARALAIAQRPTPAKGFNAYDVLRSWADADPKEHPNHHPDNIPHLRREWEKLHADTDAIIAALAAAGLAAPEQRHRDIAAGLLGVPQAERGAVWHIEVDGVLAMLAAAEGRDA